MFVFTLAFVTVFAFVAGIVLYDRMARQETVEMPGLVRLSEAEALRRITAAGLEFGSLEERIDPNVAPGTVIDQNPKQHMEVKKGRRVTIVVAAAGETTAVPNLSGKESRFVGFELREKNLSQGETKSVYHGLVGPNLVIATDPPAGSKVPVGTRVDLLESQGPKPGAYVMPDLVSMVREEASDMLRQVGVVPVIKAKSVSSGQLLGKVVGQKPLPGHKLVSGGRVELEIGAR